MIKLSGCLLIIILCTMIGVSRSNALKERTRSLRILTKMLEDTIQMIRYRKSTVSEITDKINEDEVSRKILRGENNSLSEEGKSIVKNFLSELGTSDTEGQISMITACLTSCNRLTVSSEQEETAKCRLYEQLGFMLGSFIAVLLI